MNRACQQLDQDRQQRRAMGRKLPGLVLSSEAEFLGDKFDGSTLPLPRDGRLSP